MRNMVLHILLGSETMSRLEKVTPPPSVTLTLVEPFCRNVKTLNISVNYEEYGPAYFAWIRNYE